MRWKPICLPPVLLLAAVSAARTAWAQATVTLSPGAAPPAGQAGVHSIHVIGSNFPSGTIPPANVRVTLEPATAGAGPTASTKATAVITLIASARRVAFQIPVAIAVAAPTAYLVSLAGTTAAGVAFASANTAALTVNPPASIALVTPNAGEAGLTLAVTITTTLTDFVQGATQASFGPGIAVAEGPEGGFGPVTVLGPTTATAEARINPSALAGVRTVTVKTGPQQASLPAGFTVTGGVPDPDEVARQAAWTGFKDAIRRGDLAAALAFVNPESEDIQAFVRALKPDQRGRIDAILPPIRLIEVYPDGRTARYEAVRVTVGVLTGYEVSFVRDLGGRWVIDGF